MPTRKNLTHKIEARQVSAKERQAKSDLLTVEQKLAKAVPGSKEHTRLSKRVTVKA